MHSIDWLYFPPWRKNMRRFPNVKQVAVCMMITKETESSIQLVQLKTLFDDSAPKEVAES